MSRRWFGTDGIRGTANLAPVTPEMALRLGLALGVNLPPAQAGVRPAVVIGRDTRLSGPMLESAVAAGLAAAGADVLLAGVVPTPAVATLTRRLGAAAGVVISASHNPYPDNGIKLFDHAGFKLADAVEADLERHMAAVDDTFGERPTGVDVGRIAPLADGPARYLEYLHEAGGSPNLNATRIVLDAAHGAASTVGAQFLADLGADLHCIGVQPDGQNINVQCGATHPEAAAAEVRRTGADIGVVLDGDADRLILIDDRGEPLDGDEILAIVARYRPAWAAAGIVGTVMSNVGLEIFLRDSGIPFVRAAVGDRYVLDEMRRRGAILGGEPSGHLLFLDAGTTGDGLLAAARMLEIIVNSGLRLSELRRVMTRRPQVLLNVRVVRREDPDGVPDVARVLSEVRRVLDGRGRVLVRYSGTEPLMRIMVEGPDGDEARALAERIATVVCAELGA